MRNASNWIKSSNLTVGFIWALSSFPSDMIEMIPEESILNWLDVIRYDSSLSYSQVC